MSPRTTHAGTGGENRQRDQRSSGNAGGGVLLGSQEAGTAVTALTDVESTVAKETEYDIHIVRTSPRNMSALDGERGEERSQERLS
jgi:hypothetical protein